MKHKRRVLALLRRALQVQKLGAATSHPLVASLERLKDSGRPLLFAGMPRMLRGDGRTATALENKLRYIEDDAEGLPSVPVSQRRWTRALATSRMIARRRTHDRRG